MQDRKKNYEAGKKAFKKGKKALKTGIFKWSADLEGATQHFIEAAKFFEDGERLQDAMEARQELAKVYDKLHDNFSASRELEQAGELAFDLGDLAKMVSLYEQAAFYYGLLDNPRKQSNCYVKIAEHCAAKGDLMRAEGIYRKQLQNAMDDDKFFFNGRDMLSAHTNLCLKFQNTSDYIKIIDMQKRYIKFQRRDDKFPHLVGRAWICIAAVHFIWGEGFKVEECLESMLADQQSQISDQYRALDRLLRAYESSSRSEWEAAIRQAVITNLEKEMLKKLKQVALPQQGPKQGEEENKEDYLQRILIGENKGGVQRIEIKSPLDAQYIPSGAGVEEEPAPRKVVQLEDYEEPEEATGEGGKDKKESQLEAMLL